MDLIKYDMTDIWAVAGDVTAPDSAKIRAGWGVELVPRQWWNWFENRQDNNIAYILQKGIPEWDEFTEYFANKSYIQRNGIIYRSILTGTNQDPALAPTYWVKAFTESSAASDALSGLTPVANTMPYFTGATTAATTALTAYARSLLDDVDASAARTTLSAQALNVNLTALSAIAGNTNLLTYFTNPTTMATTSLTAFGRSLIAAADANAVNALLGTDSNVAAGIAIYGLTPTGAISIGGANLNTMTSIGFFGQATGATATLALNYPVIGLAGTLLVQVVGAIVSHTYIGTTGEVYNRAYNGTTWTGWRKQFDSVNTTAVGQAVMTAVDKPAATSAINAVPYDSTTGAAQLPVGTNAQRPANGSGKLRYNSDIGRPEINNGTAWGSLGGATGGGNDAVFYLNDQTVNSNYTIAANQNAMTAGPIAIANGVVVTISSGAVWTVV